MSLPILRLVPHPRSMDGAAFVTRFGGVYEHAPWVAQEAWAAGLPATADDPAVLAAAMAAIVDAAGQDRQLALLRAHPELAGRLAVAGALTQESRSEQAAARLDQCSPDEYARFQSLNERYGARFGFPFIIAVRGLDRTAILEAFGARVEQSVAEEFAAALAQVHKIARLRLAAMARA